VFALSCFLQVVLTCSESGGLIYVVLERMESMVFANVLWSR